MSQSADYTGNLNNTGTPQRIAEGTDTTFTSTTPVKSIEDTAKETPQTSPKKETCPLNNSKCSCGTTCECKPACECKPVCACDGGSEKCADCKKQGKRSIRKTVAKTLSFSRFLGSDKKKEKD